MIGAYDDEIQTALELIEEAGQQCVWRKGATVLTDPERPWLGGADAPVEHQPFIAFLPATDGNSSFGLSKFRKGDDVINFSTFGLMGAQAFEPQVGDVLLRGGSPLVIVAVDSIKPAEEAVLHILSIE